MDILRVMQEAELKLTSQPLILITSHNIRLTFHIILKTPHSFRF